MNNNSPHRQIKPSRFPRLIAELPHWIDDFLPNPDHVFNSIEERMELVINLARKNVIEGSGGPFAAAIFNMNTKKLIAPGVNIVVSSNWSGGHGEMLAYAIAQQVLKTHDLGGSDSPPCELVTSTEPCAMCFGATPWSGVRQLVCGARDEDARAIGFDEGPKLSAWSESLEQRGIHVIRDILRDQAKQVLQDYKTSGGIIYNGREQG